MNMRTDVEVIINNKRYTISGYESEEYLQKIASYINGKYARFKETENFAHLDPEIKNVLMEINLADDYYKALEHKQELELDIERKNKEIFDLKHDLLSLQEKYDKLEEKYNECLKNMIYMETERESK